MTNQWREEIDVCQGCGQVESNYTPKSVCLCGSGMFGSRVAFENVERQRERLKMLQIGSRERHVSYWGGRTILDTGFSRG